MISNLVALNLLTGKQAYLDRAHAIADAFAAELGRNALGHCGLLAGFYDLLAPQHVVVIASGAADQASPLARAMLALSLPGAVQQVVGSGDRPRQPGPCRQDRRRRQAHRLRLHRPGVLAARHRPRCPARPLAPAAGRRAGLKRPDRQTCARRATLWMDRTAPDTSRWPSHARCLTLASLGKGWGGSRRCRCVVLCSCGR